MTTAKRAAFFRAEGVLLSRGVLAATAYYAANAQKFSERALRLGVVALSAPLQGLLGQNDRTLANRLAFLAARGMSEDRLAELGEEYGVTDTGGRIPVSPRLFFGESTVFGDAVVE